MISFLAHDSIWPHFDENNSGKRKAGADAQLPIIHCMAPPMQCPCCRRAAPALPALPAPCSTPAHRPPLLRVSRGAPRPRFSGRAPTCSHSVDVSQHIADLCCPSSGKCSPPSGCGVRSTSTTSSCPLPSTAPGPRGTPTSTTAPGKQWELLAAGALIL